MKKTAVFIIATLSTLSSLQCFAIDKKGEAYADIGVFSHYVWRGQKLSEGAAIQPSIGIIYEGVGINFWSNFDQKTKEHNETDFTIDYAFSYDNFEFDVGYVYYAVDGSGSDETGEIFLSTAYDALLSPSATLYYDTDEGDGGFVEISVSHALNVSDALELNIGALASYNLSNSLMEEDDKAFNGFYNGDLSISLPYSISDALSVEASIGYSFPLSSKAEKAIQSLSFNEDSELFYGGVMLSLAF